MAPLLRLAATAAIAGTLLACSPQPAPVSPPVVTAPAGASPLTASAGSVVDPTPAVPSASSTAGPSRPASASTSPAAYRLYRNPRFGFTADVPADYTAGDVPPNGDGLAFTSPDGEVWVQLVGANNALRETSDGRRVDDVARAQARGSTITYVDHHDDVSTISGLSADGATIFYSVTYVNPMRIQRMTWIYPAAAQAEVGPLLEHAAATFTPGTL